MASTVCKYLCFCFWLQAQSGTVPVPGGDGENIYGTLKASQWALISQGLCPKGSNEDVQFGVKFCTANWDKQQDNHPGKPCIVYDLGVRDKGGFALAFIENFGCNVRAYDPSLVTAHWYDQDKNAQGAGMHTFNVSLEKDPAVDKLRSYEKAGRYKLFREAAGEKDGNVTLYAYNWNQVSIIRATEASKDKQEAYVVKSSSLPTMMKINGETHIDVLKIDIEGSEFAVLNGAFDQMGCPPVEHILAEFHCSDMDFASGACHKLLALEERMKKCGYTKYNTAVFYRSSSSARKLSFDLDTIYYGHAAYCRTCLEPNSEM